MPRISVIVPARDVVDYVPACLADLRQQRFQDFEVLVVDDGSIDGTREVLDRCSSGDARFKVLDGGGLGPGAARNLGLDAASGAEVAFVDADDRVSPRFLERLHDALRSPGVELACGNVRRLRGFETTLSRLHAQAMRSTTSGPTHLTERPRLVYDSTVWNKLASRELWERARIRFPERRSSEDLLPSLTEHVAATGTHVVTEVLYYWRVRADASASLTERKFVDARKRLQSLWDRLDALDCTRDLLLDAIGAGPVLDAFDERTLWLDLRSYLALYPYGDDEYRTAVVEACGDYLRRHHVDPSRHGLGLLLDEAYVALLEDDRDLLGRTLDPTTRLVAEPQGAGLRVRMATPEAHTGWWERLKGRRDAERLERVNAAPQLNVEARVDRLDLDPRTTSPLEVAGRIRVRDGRTEVDAPWEVGLELVGADTCARLAGPTSSGGPLPTGERHPLLASGWRPFTASVDLAALAAHEDEGRWRLTIRVVLGGVVLEAETTCSPDAVRSLGPGRSLAAGTDLVPTATRTRRAELRRVAAPVRLLNAWSADEAHLWVAVRSDDPSVDSARLWLEGAGVRGEPVTVDLASGTEVRARLTKPDLSPGQEATLALRTVAGGGGSLPVRADCGLRTLRLTSVTDPAQLELVLRPTANGRVVVEARSPRRELAGFFLIDRGGGEPGICVTGPPIPSPRSEPVRLEMSCPWTGDHRFVPVTQSSKGWKATLPLSDLVGNTDGELIRRRWNLRHVDSDERAWTLRVPVEERHRFPLEVASGTLGARLELVTSGRARLSVAPRVDRAR